MSCIVRISLPQRGRFRVRFAFGRRNDYCDGTFLRILRPRRYWVGLYMRHNNTLGWPILQSQRIRGKGNQIPKWESLKNKSGKVACFSSSKNDRQLTSFHQRSTTNSPAKNHVLHHVFAKTPSKNG